MWARCAPRPAGPRSADRPEPAPPRVLAARRGLLLLTFHGHSCGAAASLQDDAARWLSQTGLGCAGRLGRVNYDLSLFDPDARVANIMDFYGQLAQPSYRPAAAAMAPAVAIAT